MPTLETCRTEIEELHAFFVEWYAGNLEADDFDRMEQAIAPGFELIGPDGERLSREETLEWVRDSRGKYAEAVFDIEIRDVECVERFDDHALIRYEEWQTLSGNETGRISTVLFREEPDRPGGLAWVDLQETWLEPDTDG